MAKIKDRKSITATLPYEKDKYIEVTSWVNGEGYDININDEKYISLHYDEINLIKTLMCILDNPHVLDDND